LKVVSENASTCTSVAFVASPSSMLFRHGATKTNGRKNNVLQPPREDDRDNLYFVRTIVVCSETTDSVTPHPHPTPPSSEVPCDGILGVNKCFLRVTHFGATITAGGVTDQGTCCFARSLVSVTPSFGPALLRSRLICAFLYFLSAQPVLYFFCRHPILFGWQCRIGIQESTAASRHE